MIAGDAAFLSFVVSFWLTVMCEALMSEMCINIVQILLNIFLFGDQTLLTGPSGWPSLPHPNRTFSKLKYSGSKSPVRMLTGLLVFNFSSWSRGPNCSAVCSCCSCPYLWKDRAPGRANIGERGPPLVYATIYFVLIIKVLAH